ncbi:peptidase [Candidatus Poribacteria bacterium]|nr:peptidase [Candidatus Poribacteria bacterium]MYA99485.1 peptidase [Candidatus Poribacteria bacterium]
MSGYYRSPTICQDTIVFVCEDDLWTVPVEGGVARRLTSNLGLAGSPRLSPDCELLAFSGREEGPSEVYIMPALGGEAKRLTYQGSNVSVVGWDANGKDILYSSGAGLAFDPWIWKVSSDGGEPERLPYGPANHIDFGDTGGVVLGRLTREPARWKRYRGGTAGQLWIDIEGDGQFQPLNPVDSNFTTPMWIGERIYFISDHEGVGNIYSCLPTGEDIQRHTHQDTYYCRLAQTDGTRIVYHAGADLFVYDLENDTETHVDVEFRSPRIQRQRKFVNASAYLQEFAPAPDGHALAVTVRGKPFTMANWEGAVLQHGERDGARYRFTQWLNDGKRLVTISDAGGEEALEIHTRDGSADVVRLDALDIGHVRELSVSPQTESDENDTVLLVNHRFELLHIDLKTHELRTLDKGHYQSIRGASWSPDGKWCAYSFAPTETTRSIKLCKIETGETWLVTEPEFSDFAPAWDPDGKYLYFLSYREFNPVYDALHFDLGFPTAMRPLLITLQETLGNPFVPEPRPLEEEKEDKDKEGEEEKQDDGDKASDEKSEKKKDKPEPITIDVEGISQRVVAFPYPRGRYGQIAGIEGKVIFTAFPGEDTPPSSDSGDGPRGTLHVYDFKEQKKDTLVSGIDGFRLSRDAKTLAYVAGNRLRVIRAGKKVEKSESRGGSSRQTGWIDLNRIKASVVPTAEWHQMYREAWRLQRDFFWTEDMSGVDWEHVYQRYLPLLNRIATRGEFSDLMWEMQGELGTSHAYEMGGDYRSSPNYAQGFLGADFAYDAESNGYRITHIPRGDGWEASKDSPLNAPGVNVRKGDILLAIGGQRVSETVSPGELLVSLANQEVQATFQNVEDGEKQVVTLKVLGGEHELRYREWVSQNRRYVHEKTDGKVGYVHIPDMGRRGYAEFHRGFLTEVSYPGLLVDVRYNGGGHVSQLLLEKLSRRRIGYDVPRWGTPHPYPDASVLGPIVAVTNENAGSDGDIFSHCFKLMELGLLIGKRTWGGVIGISPHQAFVDRGGTTQPEYSFWFVDVGWSVENYGTDPDIEVDYRPQDYITDADPQLDRAIEELLRQMEENPPELPDFGERPRLTLPTLPKAE